MQNATEELTKFRLNVFYSVLTNNYILTLHLEIRVHVFYTLSQKHKCTYTVCSYVQEHLNQW